MPKLSQKIQEIAGKPLFSLELPTYPNLLSLALMMGMWAFQIELHKYTLEVSSPPGKSEHLTFSFTQLTITKAQINHNTNDVTKA